MKTKIVAMILAAGIVGAVLVARATAQPEAVSSVPESVTANPLMVDREEALKNLAAESNPDQALYLSALQAMELGRRSGDMAAAEKLLNRIAGECPRQNVRTAIRRVLFAYHLENGDHASAKTNLETIVAENLTQY